MSNFELDLGDRLISNASWDDVKAAIENLDHESSNLVRFGELDPNGKKEND